MRARGQGRLGVATGINWDAEKRLGQMSDVALALLLGVSDQSVYAARKARGIPPFSKRGGESRSTDGDGSLLQTVLGLATTDALLAEVRRRMAGGAR